MCWCLDVAKIVLSGRLLCADRVRGGTIYSDAKYIMPLSALHLLLKTYKISD